MNRVCEELETTIAVLLAFKAAIERYVESQGAIIEKYNSYDGPAYSIWGGISCLDLPPPVEPPRYRWRGKC
jgi:hypothetical protein